MKTCAGYISLMLLATGCGNIDTHENYGNEQWLTSLPDALTQAKDEGKLVLLDFTGSDWCPPCKMLHDKVLARKEFLDHASKTLVLVMLDFPRNKPQTDELKKANQGLSEKFKIRGYPTLVLLDDEGNELAREVGLAHQNPDELIAWMNDNTPK